MTERASLKDACRRAFGSGASSRLGRAASVTATALATASSCVCVSDRATSRTPRSRATSAARPARIAVGRPWASRPTDTSVKAIPCEKPVPSALRTASRAAHRAA